METIVNETVEALRLGKTILYPTDTIWGIGCNAQNASAVERLYKIKERDRSKSMLVLVEETDKVLRVLQKMDNTSDRPTTYILPREVWEGEMGLAVAGNVVADDGTLGVRCPRHRFCQAVMHRLGAPLVSTSANLSGHPSPSCYKEIEKALVERLDYCVPPLAAFGSHETRGSRIVKFGADGTLAVIRP